MADKKSTKNKSLARRGTKGNPKSSRTASQRRVVRALPKSKAKNACELLSDVARIVLEEPRRLHMNFWRFIKRDGENGIRPRLGYPACGTVACIGGWVETLKPNIGAYTVLGIDYATGAELFYPKDILDAAGDFESGEAQTLKHARDVVAHIRRFQRKYAAQLKAKSVIA